MHQQLKERQDGVTMRVCAEQLQGLAAAGISKQDWARIVIAYEPVWAIGESGS